MNGAKSASGLARVELELGLVHIISLPELSYRLARILRCVTDWTVVISLNNGVSGWNLVDCQSSSCEYVSADSQFNDRFLFYWKVKATCICMYLWLGRSCFKYVHCFKIMNLQPAVSCTIGELSLWSHVFYLRGSETHCFSTCRNSRHLLYRWYHLTICVPVK